MSQIEDELKKILNNSIGQVTTQIVGLVNDAKNEANETLKAQGAKMEKYIHQLATGEITREDFEENVRDLARIVKIEAAKLSAEAKVRADKISQGVETAVINGVCKLIHLG